MSQGFLVKGNDYSSYSKNQSFIYNNENNHEDTSNNNINEFNNINNSSFILLKDLRDREPREGITKHETKNNNDINYQKKIIKKKMNIKNHQFDYAEGAQHLILRKMENIKSRHKSVNFENQRDCLFSANLLGTKNMILGKNSSEYVNDSSKQVRPRNKNIPITYNSKFQIEKNKYDDNVSRPSIINNNDYNLNSFIYNNQNTETASYLKHIIQSKIRIIMPDIKQDTHMNIIMERKIELTEFLKFILSCFKNKGNKVQYIYKFRNKLLSEEHLYKVHINLYLLEKIFQIDEPYKFDVNELFNNL